MKQRIIWTMVLVSLAVFAFRDAHALTPEKRAKAICRGEILKRLKDPNSAEFGTSVVRQRESGEWLVLREVSAKNSFGALVRSVMTCTISADFERASVIHPGTLRAGQ